MKPKRLIRMNWRRWHLFVCCLGIIPILSAFSCSNCQSQSEPGSVTRESEKLAPTEMEMKMSIEQIKVAYGGRIDAASRGQAALDSVRVMNELMAEWNPLFCRSADLVAIMGQPTRQTPESLDYAFDGGRTTVHFIFKLSGDVVVGVEYVPGR